MTERSSKTSADSDWSFAGTRRRQRRAGLLMTPAERLAWLEEMLDELLPLVGRARDAEKKREPSRP
jgi:hypothetical protein